MYAAKSLLVQENDECITQNQCFSVRIHRFPIFGPTCPHIASGRFLGFRIEAIWHHHGLRSHLNLLSDRARPLPSVLKIACDCFKYVYLAPLWREKKCMSNYRVDRTATLANLGKYFWPCPESQNEARNRFLTPPTHLLLNVRNEIITFPHNWKTH